VRDDAGAEDLADIERWAKRKLDFLRRFLPFERGIPSHDTLNDVTNALPAGRLSDCFIIFVSWLRDNDLDLVAIPGSSPGIGRTSRRAPHNQKRRAGARLDLVA
jgi:hypothetical protein